MLAKAIPVLHSYLATLKIIDMHIVRQQVSLSLFYVSGCGSFMLHEY